MAEYLKQSKFLSNPNYSPASESTSFNSSNMGTTSETALNNKLYLCPGCTLHYDCSNRNNLYIGRIPLVLNCDHTICLECITKLLSDNRIACPVCKGQSLVHKEMSLNITELFPPNFYLLGVILWSKPQDTDLRNISLMSSNTTLKNKRIMPAVPDLVDETNSLYDECCFMSCPKRATMHCEQCSDVYCMDCCSAIHKSAKSLWCHTPTAITAGEKLSMELMKCREHNAMEMEMFCKTCNMAACCYCILENHEGHDRTSLTKLSATEVADFETFRNVAERVFQQLLATEKRVKSLTGCCTAPAENDVSNCFANLHAKLYAIEKKVRKELSATKTCGKGLTMIRRSLAMSMNTIKPLLTAARMYNNTHNKKINLKLLLDKLKSVGDTPCHLLATNGTLEPVKFSVDSILDNLECYFNIVNAEDFEYKLVGIEQLPVDYQFEESQPDLCATSSYVEHEISPSYSFYQKKEPTRTNRTASAPRKKYNDKFVNDNERVTVTYIKSLECFFVQLKKFQQGLNTLNRQIAHSMEVDPQDTVDSPELSELYLAMYMTKKDSHWFRARVVEINSGDVEESYEVFFIDYGYTQIVTKDRLREIPANLTQKRPFALTCQLYNPTFANWNKNAHLYLGKIINGKEVHMFLKSQSCGTYVVDLMVNSSDGGLTSASDLLINTCANALSSSDDGVSPFVAPVKTFTNDKRVFSNSMKFVRNQSEEVVIAAVINPHSIFVHIVAFVELLNKLSNSIKEHFKHSQRDDFIPVTGSYVVVHSKDAVRGNYHRALVKKVDIGTEQAHVLLIDWGVNVVVPLKKIRLMTDNFTRLECQALLIKMAHIAPYNQEPNWMELSTAFLQKYFTQQKMLKMVVHSTKPLEVALFDVQVDMDVCLNAQLVRQNLASSTGKISMTLEWPRNDGGCGAEAAVDDGVDGLVNSLLKKLDMNPDEEDCEDDMTQQKGLKQRVDIVRVESPQLIYIKFPAFEKMEQTLYKELQIHYMSEQSTKETWSENEYCVVHHPMHNEFARGVIRTKNTDDMYNVYLFDKAEDVVVPTKRIYVYSSYFLKYRNVTFKCHLANIRPAGDTGDWSQSSIEVLEHVFAQYPNVYVIKVPGDTSNKSMPVKMWYERYYEGEALEPAVIKFISVNKLLVRLGFAFNENRTADSTADSAEETVEMFSMPPPDLLEDQTTTPDVEVKVEKDDDVDVSVEIKLDETNPDEEDNADEEEVVVVDWLPPFPIKNRAFKAVVTCAEIEGFLYLYDEKLHRHYQSVEKNMKVYFDEHPPKPLPASDWEPGQMCTIACDSFFYRGQICTVLNSKEIVAFMIDFGSDHVCKPSQLFRTVMYPNVPAFATKVRLGNVFSRSGEWLSSDYDVLMSLISERASVVVLGGSLNDSGAGSGELVVDVTTDAGVNINKRLVELCPNLYSRPETSQEDDDDAAAADEDNDVMIESEIVCGAFKMSPLPLEVFTEPTTMTVANVLAYNSIVLSVEPDERLQAIRDDIQSCVQSQPQLMDIVVGKPCVCPHQDGDIWLRGRIHSIDGLDCGYVFVFFVDLGQVDSVACKDLRVAMPKWLDVPVSFHIARLNVTVAMEGREEHAFQHMRKLCGCNKLVEVVLEDPLTVNLFDKTGNGKLVLCYQSLIDRGLLHLVDMAST